MCLKLVDMSTPKQYILHNYVHQCDKGCVCVYMCVYTGVNVVFNIVRQQ